MVTPDEPRLDLDGAVRAMLAAWDRFIELDEFDELTDAVDALRQTAARSEQCEAIRDAIRLGYEGEAIAGIELLVDRFPDIAEDA